MKLNRIAVTDFRKLSRVTVEGLRPGLNVIVGDNEVGKSTLLAAMRAALFERYRVTGQVVEDMLPYGRQARPTIEIDFSKDGVSYRLMKAFAQRPEALLIGDGQQWSGDAADDELARILGFTRPGRGESKPEQHHGVFGMMWVTQGASHQGPTVSAAREQLAGALEREVGEVAGGEHGRVLLQRAQERLEQFWDKRRRPRGDYAKAIEELETLKAQREAVAGRLASLEAEIDRLGEVRQRLEAHGASGTIEKARQVLGEAERAVAALDGLRQQATNAENALKLAELKQAEAARKHADRQGLQQAVRQAIVDIEDKRSAAETARAQLTRLESDAEAAGAAAEAAVRAEQEARQALQALELAETGRRLRESLAAGHKQLAMAEELEGRRLAALATVASNPIDANAIARLEALSARLREAQARRDAAAVRLQLRPQYGGGAEIDGEIVASDELVITRQTTLHLFGYGEIHIQPGGGVTGVEEALHAAEGELAEALAKIGQPDIEAARAAWDRRRAAEQELPFLTSSLSAVAPQGLDRLRQDVEARTTELAALGPEQPDISAEAVEAAKRALREAADRAEEARHRAEAARNATHGARSALAIAIEREAATTLAGQQARDALTAARLIAADTELEEQAQAAAQALEAARHAYHEADLSLRQAQPEAALLKRDMAQRELDRLAADIDGLKQSRIQLEASLQALGREGLGEQLAALDGQIALTEQQLQRRHVEARAAALLHDTLVQAQRETKERWLRPIHDRALPYLNLLHAGSEVVLDEDTLELSALRRDNLLESFGDLSMGAREQVAVITRLALADILSDAGHTSCLVLDDPLVNADERRLERMHLVLHRAAQRHQILILTCRERDFTGLGAHVAYL